MILAKINRCKAALGTPHYRFRVRRGTTFSGAANLSAVCLSAAVTFRLSFSWRAGGFPTVNEPKRCMPLCRVFSSDRS